MPDVLRATGAQYRGRLSNNQRSLLASLPQTREALRSLASKRVSRLVARGLCKWEWVNEFAGKVAGADPAAPTIHIHVHIHVGSEDTPESIEAAILAARLGVAEASRPSA